MVPVAWLLLVSCGVPMEDLESGNLKVQEKALNRLPTWQTRWVIHQLEWSATSTRYKIYEPAFDALVRADTLEAEVILRRYLVDDPGDLKRRAVISALGRHSTKRSCDLLAELWVVASSRELKPNPTEWPLPDEKELKSLEYDLSSTSLRDGWQCFQSLAPYRKTNPRADALWREANPY